MRGEAMTERIRPMIPRDDIAHAPGHPFDVSSAPCAGDCLRIGNDLYNVSNDVHIVGGDLAAEAYLLPEFLQDLEDEIEIFGR